MSRWCQSGGSPEQRRAEQERLEREVAKLQHLILADRRRLTELNGRWKERLFESHARIVESLKVGSLTGQQRLHRPLAALAVYSM